MCDFKPYPSVFTKESVVFSMDTEADSFFYSLVYQLTSDICHILFPAGIPTTSNKWFYFVYVMRERRIGLQGSSVTNKEKIPYPNPLFRNS